MYTHCYMQQPCIISISHKSHGFGIDRWVGDMVQEIVTRSMQQETAKLWGGGVTWDVWWEILRHHTQNTGHAQIDKDDVMSHRYGYHSHMHIKLLLELAMVELIINGDTWPEDILGWTRPEPRLTFAGLSNIPNSACQLPWADYTHNMHAPQSVNDI